MQSPRVQGNWEAGAAREDQSATHHHCSVHRLETEARRESWASRQKKSPDEAEQHERPAAEHDDTLPEPEAGFHNKSGYETFIHLVRDSLHLHERNKYQESNGSQERVQAPEPESNRKRHRDCQRTE